MAMLVASCTTSGGNNCAGWKPIILAGQSIDGLTDQDAGEILAHNVYGEKQDCW